MFRNIKKKKHAIFVAQRMLFNLMETHGKQTSNKEIKLQRNKII